MTRRKTNKDIIRISYSNYLNRILFSTAKESNLIVLESFSIIETASFDSEDIVDEIAPRRVVAIAGNSHVLFSFVAMILVLQSN